MRLVVLTAIVVALSAQSAFASSWGFDWTCAGACAPGQLDVRGHEGGFGSESACESARTQKAFEINSEGSAGSTTDCVDSDPGNPAPNSGPGRAMRAARLGRAYFAVDGGRGYKASYADGRTETGASQVGGQIEFTFGRDIAGLGIELGLRRDAGTSPAADVPASPMWLLDLGIGLATSPFAFYTGPRLEVRPDIGAFYIWAIRLGCTRCETDFANPMPVEPNQGNTFRVRGGIDIYWGEKRDRGIAVDALIGFGSMGDIAADSDEPTSVEMHPPRFLLRLSYVRRQVDPATP